MNARHVLVVAALVASSAAQAVTIFSTDFNSEVPGLGLNPGTKAPTGFTIVPDGNGMLGSVDIIDNSALNTAVGNGFFIDLDGTTQRAGILSTTLNLTGGTTYVASFQLAGNNRSPYDDSVVVNFGSTTQQGPYILLPANTPFTTYTLSFTPATTGAYTLSFLNNSLTSDNMGALLDNVSVSTAAVPEPESLALMLAGLASVAWVARRRAPRG